VLKYDHRKATKRARFEARISRGYEWYDADSVIWKMLTAKATQCTAARRFRLKLRLRHVDR
jgi:hypothetical protein